MPNNINIPNFDFVIVGAGIIGINTALVLRDRYPQATIHIIDKEAGAGKHASGRNSGVIHAGFYYSADSLKAKFTKNGNKFLTDYCKTNKISINKCGKLVVARDAAELIQFSDLMDRAKANGVELQRISLSEAKKIEPSVSSFNEALWSPTTSSVNPNQIVSSLINECVEKKVSFCWNSAYRGRAEDGSLITSNGKIRTNYFINCAGLYADTIAKTFGFAADYRIIPFKGLYLYAAESAPRINCHVYPVPNMKNPFLGVHHSVTHDGRHKIGPTAIPALWREQYGLFDNFKFSEFCQILADELKLFLSAGFDFRSLAIEEIKKYYRPNLIRDAAMLLYGVKEKDYVNWGKPGIRAQLFNIKTRSLVMDFVTEGDKSSLHVLNAVSPAFTAARPFAVYCVNLIENYLS